MELLHVWDVWAVVTKHHQTLAGFLAQTHRLLSKRHKQVLSVFQASPSLCPRWQTCLSGFIGAVNDAAASALIWARVDTVASLFFLNCSNNFSAPECRCFPETNPASTVYASCYRFSWSPKTHRTFTQYTEAKLRSCVPSLDGKEIHIHQRRVLSYRKKKTLRDEPTASTEQVFAAGGMEWKHEKLH